MKNGELQYLADTLLLEQLFAQEFQTSLVKQAGVLDLLGGVAESIKNAVKDQVDTSSSEGIASGLANLMAPSILFRIHPIVGVLYLIGTAFGFNIADVFAKIMNALKPRLENGAVTPDEVTNIGKSIVSSIVGSIEAKASFSNDMLDHLRETDVLNIKQAQFLGKGLPKIPWLFPEEGASPLQKIFGELFKQRKHGKAKWLLGGFVVWLVKTILSGAGLLAITGKVEQGINSLRGINDQNHQEVNSSAIQTNTESTSDSDSFHEKSTETSAKENVVAPASNKELFHASGRGEQIFPNDDSHIWIVPLINSNISETLLNWCFDIYPNTYSYSEKIENLPSFQKTVELLKSHHTSFNPQKLAIPKPFNNRKQIVDSFIKDLLHN